MNFHSAFININIFPMIINLFSIPCWLTEKWVLSVKKPLEDFGSPFLLKSIHFNFLLLLQIFNSLMYCILSRNKDFSALQQIIYC